MKHLASLALIPLALSLCSCALANKLIQAPVRLIQAAGRTLTDAGDPSPPATADSASIQRVALRNAGSPPLQ